MGFEQIYLDAYMELELSNNNNLDLLKEMIADRMEMKNAG